MESITKHNPSHPLLKHVVSSIIFWRRSKDDDKSTIFLPNDICGFGLTLSGEFHVKRNADFQEMPAFGTRNTMDKACEIKTTGDFLNISVRFVIPNGLYLFTKIPMSVVYEQDAVSLDAIFNYQDLKDLAEKLANTATDTQKTEIIESFLVSKMIYTCPPLLRNIIQLINYSKGLYNVSYIAKQFSLTERTIHRYFSKYIGISPISYINLIRFRSVISLNEASSLDTLNNALEVGYYDQSHFIKHFKEFSTVTPTRFTHLKKKNTLSDFYNF